MKKPTTSESKTQKESLIEGNETTDGFESVPDYEGYSGLAIHREIERVVPLLARHLEEESVVNAKLWDRLLQLVRLHYEKQSKKPQYMGAMDFQGIRAYTQVTRERLEKIAAATTQEEQKVLIEDWAVHIEQDNFY